MNTHNDIERMIDEAIAREDDMYQCAALYLEAEERDKVWIGAEHARAVRNHHEADGMLDAALDEVFEQTFRAIPSGPLQWDTQVINVDRSHQDAVLHWMGLRLAELMGVRELAYSEIGRRHVVASALKCPVDKVCRTRDGAWTMR